MLKSLLPFALCCALSTAALTAHAQAPASPPAAPAVVYSAPAVEYTFMQALPGKREQLKRFIIANWFAMDAIAKDQGLMESYKLLEVAESIEPWDLVMVVQYKTPQGYAGISPDFERIRAAHKRVLIDGFGFNDLGKIVLSRKMHEVMP